jgi:putative acetyltransferase
VSALAAVSLRSARDDDRKAIWGVHVEAIRELCAGWYAVEQIELWIGRLTPDSYRSAILNRVVVVAERDVDIVGFGQLDVARREIEAIYVVPALARQGLGSRLLRRLEEIARRQGAGRLGLCASLNAEAFYAAHAYRVVAREQQRLTDAVVLPCIRMEKVLR